MNWLNGIAKHIWRSPASSKRQEWFYFTAFIRLRREGTEMVALFPPFDACDAKPG